MKLDDVTRARLARSARAHKNLFEIFYARPLSISKSSFRRALTELQELVRVADYYACREAVDVHIRNHLLHYRYSLDLLKMCSCNAENGYKYIEDALEMLEFSLETRCEWIFKAVMVHMLSSRCQWNEIWSGRMQGYKLKQLGESKAAELQALKSTTLLRIMACTSSPSSEEVFIQQGVFIQQLGLMINSGVDDDRIFRCIANGRMPNGQSMTVRLKSTRNPIKKIAEKAKVRINLPFAAVYDESHYLSKAARIANELLTNPTNVCLSHQPDAGTDLAPLVCINITDDDLPWKSQE